MSPSTVNRTLAMPVAMRDLTSHNPGSSLRMSGIPIGTAELCGLNVEPYGAPYLAVQSREPFADRLVAGCRCEEPDREDGFRVPGLAHGGYVPELIRMREPLLARTRAPAGRRPAVTVQSNVRCLRPADIGRIEGTSGSGRFPLSPPLLTRPHPNGENRPKEANLRLFVAYRSPGSKTLQKAQASGRLRVVQCFLAVLR